MSSTGDPGDFHVASAEHLVSGDAHSVRTAHVHAMIAVAEEQRTANLIALMDSMEVGHTMPPDGLWHQILDRLGVKHD